MLLRNKLAFFVIVLFVVSSASVFADPIVFTDTTSEVPGSVFTLTITSTAVPGTFNALLTADTTGANSPGTFMNYITLHLTAGSTRPSVDPNFLPTNWNAIGSGEPDLPVLGRNDFPQNNWVGLHTDGIVVNGAFVLTGGVELLLGGGATWDFDFTLAPGSILNESPSIQVGYFGDGVYHPRSGKYKYDFTQMSQTVVPEPATLLLVGSGLLGGAFFRKRSKQ